MKKAGMVLGIVGSSIGFLIVLYFFAITIFAVAAPTKEIKISLINLGQSSPADTYSESASSVNEIATLPPADTFSGNDTSPDTIVTLPPMPPTKVVTTGSDVNTYTEIFLLPLFLLFAGLIGSSLGLSGALISRKNAKTGGIFMIVGAVLNLFDIIGFILLLLGGILSLASSKQTAA